MVFLVASLLFSPKLVSSGNTSIRTSSGRGLLAPDFKAICPGTQLVLGSFPDESCFTVYQALAVIGNEWIMPLNMQGIV